MSDLTSPIRLDPQSTPDETLHVTASGFPVRIYETGGGGLYPIHGAVYIHDRWEGRSWLADGKYQMSGEEHAFDLRDRPKTKRGAWVALMKGNDEEFFYDAEFYYSAKDREALEEWARSWGFKILKIGYLEECTDD